MSLGTRFTEKGYREERATGSPGKFWAGFALRDDAALAASTRPFVSPCYPLWSRCFVVLYGRRRRLPFVAMG